MQGELFQMSGSVTDASKLSLSQPSWLDRFRVTLRLDHLSILGVSALVLYVLVFSFGVEKGKRMALRELAAEKAKQEEMTPPVVAVSTLPTPPVSGPTPSPAVGKYTIQVITFTSQSRAEEEVRKLKEKGYPSFIIPGGRFFQVCVDRFETLNEARQKLFLLKEEGFAPRDAYIRPLQGGQVSF